MPDVPVRVTAPLQGPDGGGTMASVGGVAGVADVECVTGTELLLES